ncbi:hypothetical protein [Oceanobacillus sp. J11TS1]|uniref:hypothetical protein n=1 Tax=Oceanobacillus sp. J11TS1 TaxID=2807191 RepID=UPI001B0624CB|nr:hypothetical protein [Oceanobacillus sp. J11TS1]GIO24138.1 hypothetical protein J11TS1_27190 [Oceanobacillus sp. J11TS1]
MRQNKSPLIFDKPSGNIPNYDQKADNLLQLNAKIKSKLKTIKRDHLAKRSRQ